MSGSVDTQIDTPPPASSPPAGSEAEDTVETTTEAITETSGKDEDEATVPNSPTAAAPVAPAAAKAATGPKKRGGAAKVKKEDDHDFEDEEGTQKKKAKSAAKKDVRPVKERQRKAPASGKIASAKIIARSYDECSEADKRLLDMRDAGKGWTEIRKVYQEITGDTIGQSTLPNRYARLKANLTVIKEEDNAALLEAKGSVEGAFEREKWNLIADAMTKLGADRYKGDMLQKQYKKLMFGATTALPKSVKASDLDSGEEDDE